PAEPAALDPRYTDTAPGRCGGAITTASVSVIETICPSFSPNSTYEFSFGHGDGQRCSNPSPRNVTRSPCCVLDDGWIERRNGCAVRLAVANRRMRNAGRSMLRAQH